MLTDDRSMKRFLSVFVATLLMLGLLFVALPALLLLSNVPPFRIGHHLLLILEWRNDAQGTGITFGLLPLGLVSLTIAMIEGVINRDRS